MKRGNSGLTLLEVLVVLFIVSAVTVIGLNWFRQLDKYSLRSAVFRLRYFIRYAELLSVERSEDVVVVVQRDCTVSLNSGEFKRTLDLKRVSRKLSCESECGGEGEAVIVVSQGYVSPCKILVRCGEKKTTIDTSKLSMWESYER